MPSSLRSSSLDRYRVALPGHLEHVDSITEENGHTSLGQAIYFDWYNHYCTLVSLFTFNNIYYKISLQGNGTPHNIHPAWLQKCGKKIWSGINISKLVPHQSKELLDNSQQYQHFVYAWEDVFLWQNGIVSYICLPFGMIIFINDVFRWKNIMKPFIIK